MPPEDVTFGTCCRLSDKDIPNTYKYIIIVNNSVMFTISRISSPNLQPLISRLLISPANSIVNGTEVICADRATHITFHQLRLMLYTTML